MSSAETTTLLFLLFILTAGLVIPELLKRFHLPLITFIILAGAVFGSNGMGFIHSNEIISFLGFLGMAFLMLMAGLDANLSVLSRHVRKIFVMAFFNGFFPFLVGLGIAKAFGYSWTTSLLVGIIFISSSVALIVSSVRNSKFISKELGQLILSSVIVTDVVSLLALGFVFQSISKITALPLPLYYLLLFLSIPVVIYFVPQVSNFLLKGRFSKDEGDERQLRYVVSILIAILAFFSFLGVHPLLGAFLAGLSLSSVVRTDKSGVLYAKLHTIGYGLFVPVFFFVVGMEMDLSLFRHFDFSNLLMISLIIGLICSKIFSGYIGGRLSHLSNRDSMVFGAVSIIQLTTTLAVTYAAASLEILDSALTTSVILLSLITTLFGPVVVHHLISRPVVKQSLKAFR